MSSSLGLSNSAANVGDDTLSHSLDLTEDQLSTFRETGVLVIEDVLSPSEVEVARESFHSHLASLGMTHEMILAGRDTPQAGPRIKSPVSRIFYSDWKLLQVHLHPRVCRLAEQLLVRTFGSGQDPDFTHPFGPFDHVRAYIDRICYRLPDCIREEGGLGLHMDRNPIDPYLFHSSPITNGASSTTVKSKGKFDANQRSGLSKWRPIQAFVALTDHFGSDSGGLGVVPGFHRKVDSYFKGRSSEGRGEFYRMNSVQHDVVRRECRPVIAPRGSLVLWDGRLPHMTAAKMTGSDTREVVYTGFLPDVPLNRAYCKKQLVAIRKNHPPPAYVEATTETSDRNWDEAQLTPAQARLLGVEDK